jgi:hypothetical protein
MVQLLWKVVQAVLKVKHKIITPMKELNAGTQTISFFRVGGSNPVPHSCQASTPPLSYIPSPQTFATRMLIATGYI